MNKRVRLTVLMVGLCCWILLPVQSTLFAIENTIQVSGRTMGPIVYNVTVAHPPTELAQSKLKKSVQATLDRINDLMSTYKSNSDVTRVSQSTSTDWIPVDAESAAVVARAIEISQQTEGAFDVTVAPAVNAWRFGPDKSDKFELPTEQEIEALKKRVGYQQLSVQLDPPAIKKSNADVSIDLSAIAKGYAVDQVGQTLRDLGCENFMVEVGGEVCVRGQRAAGGPWRIGIEKPEAKTLASIGAVAELTDQAMATSGDYRNYNQIAGRRYSHTIDPTTCQPVEHSLATACVVAPDCMTADAIATAVIVMGRQRGLELCEQLGYELLTFARSTDFGDDLIANHSPEFPFSAENQTKFQAGDNDTLDDGGKNLPDDTTQGNSILPAFIGAVAIISLAILGMAIGAIFGNKPVQGSCGGLASMTNENGETNCSLCSKPTSDCVETKT